MDIWWESDVIIKMSPLLTAFTNSKSVSHTRQHLKVMISLMENTNGHSDSYDQLEKTLEHTETLFHSFLDHASSSRDLEH